MNLRQLWESKQMADLADLYLNYDEIKKYEEQKEFDEELKSE